MSAPHHVRVVDAPGQPARCYPALSLTAAVTMARRIFATGHVSAVVKVFAGKVDAWSPCDEPVKVLS